MAVEREGLPKRVARRLFSEFIQRSGLAEHYLEAARERDQLRMTAAPVRRKPHELRGAAEKPSIFLVTLPKSGTVYIGHTVRMTLDLWHSSTVVTPKFPFNFLWPEMLADFALGGMISATHMQANEHNLKVFKRSQKKIVLHLRDPRASMVSMLHFMRKNHERFLENPEQVPKGHASNFFHNWGFQFIDFFGTDIHSQADLLIDGYYRECVRWLEDWLEVSRTDATLEFLVQTHELLKADERQYFDRIFRFYNIEQPAELVTPGRSRRTHFRTGDSDEWKELLTADQIRKVNSIFPEALADYGINV